MRADYSCHPGWHIFRKQVCNHRFCTAPRELPLFPFTLPCTEHSKSHSVPSPVIKKQELLEIRQHCICLMYLCHQLTQEHIVLYYLYLRPTRRIVLVYEIPPQLLYPIVLLFRSCITVHKLWLLFTNKCSFNEGTCHIASTFTCQGWDVKIKMH